MNILKFGFRFWLTILVGIMAIVLFFWCNAEASRLIKSNTSERFVTRYNNRSHVKNMIGMGDGQKWGIATKRNTREYGKIGQYKR